MNVRGGVAYHVRTKPNPDSARQPQDLFALAADVNYPIVAGFPTSIWVPRIGSIICLPFALDIVLAKERTPKMD